MPAPERPARRRRLADPRLLIGLALIVASVAATVGIVGAVDRRVPVYVAQHPLQVGDRVHVADLELRRVGLDGAESRYVRPGRVPAAGLVVTRSVAAGELVPAGAVARRSAVDRTSLVLRLATRPGAAVRAGSRVDVWMASPIAGSAAGRPVEDGTAVSTPAPAPPVVLVAGAVVVRLVDTGALAPTDGGGELEISLPRDRVARVLAAVVAGAPLTVVPAELADPVAAAS